jgi:hypothetical protein
MTATRVRIDTLPNLAAALLRVAAIVLLCAAHALPAVADEARGERPLAIELRVTLGDLHRLASPGLPARHAEGLEQRIRGALGLLPWLLLRTGNAPQAEALADLADRPLDTAGRAALRALLTELVARHPLDLAARADVAQPGAALARAAALHESYCAGCHDGAGDGDPDLALPARDLRRMARTEPADLVLARLALGIKGDETIAFRSPVTDRDLLALLGYYRGDPAGPAR